MQTNSHKNCLKAPVECYLDLRGGPGQNAIKYVQVEQNQNTAIP